MCIVSNWVNEAQDFITVTKYDDMPNSLIPSEQAFKKCLNLRCIELWQYDGDLFI